MENRFTVGEKDYFIKITPQAISEGKKIHNKAFRQALDDVGRVPVEVAQLPAHDPAGRQLAQASDHESGGRSLETHGCSGVAGNGVVVASRLAGTT